MRLKVRENTVLDFVSRFRERLHHANSLAEESLLSSQTVMKSHYDRSAVSHRFSVGDKALALLPILARPSGGKNLTVLLVLLLILEKLIL